MAKPPPRAFSSCRGDQDTAAVRTRLTDMVNPLRSLYFFCTSKVVGCALGRIVSL